MFLESFGLADVSFQKVVFSQPQGAQKQRYQHRVELAPDSLSGGLTVEPMEVPYTETLPDEEEGSDSVPGRRYFSFFFEMNI